MDNMNNIGSGILIIVIIIVLLLFGIIGGCSDRSMEFFIKAIGQSQSPNRVHRRRTPMTLLETTTVRLALSWRHDQTVVPSFSE